MINLPVEKLNTDRWSVITSFLDNLFNGDFPYLAKSHLSNPPGPFPGYYLFALPFYFLGEIGLFSFTGLILYMTFLKKMKVDNRNIFIIFVFLSFSCVIWYELIVRSTIFVNMAIALFYFSILNNRKFQSPKFLWLFGVLGGLVLSTRGILFYVFIVFYTYIFISNDDWKNFFIISLFTIAGFILSLLPFAIWDWKLFQLYNPITLQANFIPKIYLILFVVVSFLIGYLSKNVLRLISSTGILLFTIVGIPFIIKVLNSSLYDAISRNGFDISYFIFSVPFLAFALQLNYKEF